MRKGWRRRAVLSAQSLIGDEVRNLENQMLGRIEDIMIDVPTGRVAYAVLSFGGIMGMGNKLFALPWQALRIDDRRRQVNRRCGQDAICVRLPASTRTTGRTWPICRGATGSMASGWAATAMFSTAASCRRAALPETRSAIPAGEDLGTIEATMVDLADGRVVYAVLEFGGTLGFGTRLFAVPWRVLAPQRGREALCP